jgi:hypothetical protein
MKIDVDGYLSREWEQHCKQQEEYEMNELDKKAQDSANHYAEIKDNPITITVTIEQLAVINDALEYSVDWLKERIRQSEGSEFGDHYLERFKKDLAYTSELTEKLSDLWWKVSKAEEGL